MLWEGMVWEEFKFADCVQYPLSFYQDEDGRQVLVHPEHAIPQPHPLHETPYG